MSAEQLPKEFEKCTEVLPFTKYGLSTFEEFKQTEEEIQHHEWLKKIGLSVEEIKLYEDNENGLLDQQKKVESSVLKNQLANIYKKISDSQKDSEAESSKQPDPQPSTSEPTIFERLEKTSTTYYPTGHPMNEIKELEESLFGHLKDDMMPITKRRKILRRLERKKERIMNQEKELIPPTDNSSNIGKKGSLWDVKDKATDRKPVYGPRKRTMYTIKDNKIVRLEPVNKDGQDIDALMSNERLEPQNESSERANNLPNNNAEFRAVDIILPVNSAEEQLLEGTKMCVDDIKKIERFKDYEPGIPSKVQDDAGDISGMSQPTISLVCKQVALAIVAHRAQWIKMPQTDAEQNNVIAGFYSLCGFRQVIGAIDCTHIRIPKVGGDVGQYYINRKGYSSINVQVLYLKNISPSVTQEQLSILFNQFQLENGGSIDVQLMSGRMRGQAFVSFNSEDLAIQALDEVNGTILSGRPIIVQFGRNSNRIQDDNR